MTYARPIVALLALLSFAAVPARANPAATAAANAAAQKTRPVRSRTLAALPAATKQLMDHVYDPSAARTTPLPNKALLTGARDKRNGTAEDRGYLSLRDYQDLRDGAIELLERFPPSAHYYVGIGRSPTPVIAILQNLNASMAITLPVSGLKVRNAQAVTAHPPIALDAAWTQHLGHFLPDRLLTDLERNGRGILVIDRATSGASVSLMSDLVRRYVASRGRSVAVSAVAFSRRQVPVAKIDLENRGELRLMNKYEPWTEWPYYQVGVDAPAQLQRRPEYDEFKDQLMERMKRDPALNF